MSTMEQVAKERRKAKAILVAAIQAAGGRFARRTNLYKVFWVAHLVHMVNHGSTLSNWPIVRMPNGPAPDKARDLLTALEKEGIVRQVPQLHGPRSGYDSELLNLAKAVELTEAELTSEEIDSVSYTVQQLEGATASALSRWSHELSRAWRGARNGGTLDIYIDLLEDDEEFDALRRELRDSEEARLVDRLMGRDP
jgi:hypothetical protein